MRAIFGSLVWLVLLTARGAAADGPIRPPEVTAGPLPAGTWFRDHPYERSVLDTPPPRPTYAVARGPFRDGRAAERALAAMPRTLWQLGFPWVVASSDLRPAASCAERVFVVSALFASRAEADTFAASERGSHVVMLASGETPGCWESTWPLIERPDGAPRLEVTHVERSVDAYDASVIEALPTTDGPLPDLSHATPACTLTRDRVIVRRDGPDTFRFGYRWAPVECRGRPAWIPVEATRRHIVVEPVGEGARLHQLTGVSCDSAHFDVWQLTEEGRVPIAGEPLLFGAGCAG